jgi:hypothetical protein
VPTTGLAAARGAKVFALAAPADDLDLLFFADQPALFVALSVSTADGATTPITRHGPTGRAQCDNKGRVQDAWNSVFHFVSPGGKISKGGNDRASTIETVTS